MFKNTNVYVLLYILQISQLFDALINIHIYAYLFISYCIYPISKTLSMYKRIFACKIIIAKRLDIFSLHSVLDNLLQLRSFDQPARFLLTSGVETLHIQYRFCIYRWPIVSHLEKRNNAASTDVFLSTYCQSEP